MSVIWGLSAKERNGFKDQPGFTKTDDLALSRLYVFSQSASRSQRAMAAQQWDFRPAHSRLVLLLSCLIAIILCFNIEGPNTSSSSLVSFIYEEDHSLFSLSDPNPLSTAV